MLTLKKINFFIKPDLSICSKMYRSEVIVMTKELVRMEHINKTYPGVRALKNASFQLLSGEVHALVGENGAGKTTLVRVLTGEHLKDSG